MNLRDNNWNQASNIIFDAVIIGGGINGASIYNELCKKGLKVLLIDKGDFGCASSQASGMMIWGGLLYLRNLDLLTVIKLSRSRDKMIEEMESLVNPSVFHYISNNNGRNKYFVQFLLYFYWLLGFFHRNRPRSRSFHNESSLLANEDYTGSLLYEEAMLNGSDSRFVLQWITDFITRNTIPINYCSMESGQFNQKDRLWYIDLQDTLTGNETVARARYVINAAGVWTDKINELCKVQTPYKHVLSKGVYINLKKPEEHHNLLIFEMGQNRDVITYVPWGPVSMWGPTETAVHNIDDGFTPHKKDIQFLLESANHHLNRHVDKSDIVSIRCGIRPLTVKKTFNKECYPLDISRKVKVVKDSDLPWVSVYGGKISGCKLLAQKIASMFAPKNNYSLLIDRSTNQDYDSTKCKILPEPYNIIPTVDWSVNKELCCTLDDYLRRRTNIAQWIHGQGCGSSREYIPYLKEISRQIYEDEDKADIMTSDYIYTAQNRIDRLLEQV